MWCIEHHAIKLHGTLGAAFERRDDAPGPLALLLRRCEAAVDDVDLRGMDRNLGRKSVAPGGVGLAAQRFAVAKVREDRINRRALGAARRQQAEISRQRKGSGVAALIVAVGGGADRRRQILAAP